MAAVVAFENVSLHAQDCGKPSGWLQKRESSTPTPNPQTLNDRFAAALLQSTDGDVEKAINLLLENHIPPHLSSMPREAPLASHPPTQNTPGGLDGGGGAGGSGGGAGAPWPTLG